MSEDINVTDGTVLEALNNKVDLDGGNYAGSPLEEYIHKHCSGGLNMFDTILKDHILTYEESKGWALQGTYVYKSAVAGSRYGYADFYNKCLEEYGNANTIGTPNVTIKGSLSCVDGVLSGFSASNYAVIEKVPSNISTLEIVFKVKSGSNVSGYNSICGQETGNYTTPQMTSGTGSMSFGIPSSSESWGTGVKSMTLTANTTYWFKGEWTGAEKIFSYSTDGVTWTTSSVEQTACVWTAPLAIGIDYDPNNSSKYWTGSIDLNESYININGERWWNGGLTYKNPNGHQFYNISQKDVLDEIFNQSGTAWFYGIDTENERVFLPRNNYFEQVTADSSEVGQSVEAGLPNITGWVNTEEGYVGGAFYIEGSRGGGCNNGSNQYNGVRFDASRSSEVYGNSDTVQPPAVKKLLYICVGNTESVSSVTDVVEVTTTENDTTPLFTGMYFDFTPNNVSWLKAGEQKNSGGVYTFCYNELVNELTIPKYGLKVINEADMIVGVDYSEYWKVNQDEMTFTTPTAISNKAYSDIAPVVGNGYALGLTTNGTSTTSGINAIGYSSSHWFYGRTTNVSNIKLPATQGVENTVSDNTLFGITPVKGESGIEAHLQENITAQLYFKVANAVQNLELLDVGEVMEAVADIGSNAVLKTDCPAYIVESYVNGASGYNVYSNGYCQQWFLINDGKNGNKSRSLTYLKPFKDLNYIVLVTGHYSSTTENGWDFVYNKTTTDCKIVGVGDTSQIFACGYIA